MDKKIVNDDEYLGYIKQKHSKFSVSPDVVLNAVKKATGQDVLDYQKVITGEVNEVYDARTKDNNVIVRISRRDEDTFTPEKWAIDESRKVGVPVPKVLLIEKAGDGKTFVRVSVEEKLPGISLDSISEELFNENLRDIVFEAGKILAKIHSVASKGFGDLYDLGAGEYKTWESFIFAPLESQVVKELLSSASRLGIPKEDIDQALLILKSHSSIYQNVTSHLIHGDFGPKHILVDNEKISGILDFENVKGGDPIWDFAWWDYFRQNRPPITWLREGYEKIIQLPTDYDLRVRLYSLRLGVDLIYYFESEGNKSGITKAVENLAKDLEYFRKC